jgi:hypothetical protein
LAVTPVSAWSIAVAIAERLDEPLAMLTVTAPLLPTLMAIEPEPRLPLALADPEEISDSASASLTFVSA